MSRPSVEIEGQVFEPKKLGVWGELMVQADLLVYMDKAGWAFPDPSSFRRAVEGRRLQSFYGKPAADVFDRVTKETLWRWQCIGGEPTSRKVLILNP